MAKDLTQKMKDFCHKYLECGNATEAYLHAYDTDNRVNAQVQGNRLLQLDKITAYLDELNRPTVNRIQNEREKKRNIIWKRINYCVEKNEDAAVARYLDILNKMDAEYVNINRNIDDSGEKLAGLDTEQLKQLLDDK